MEVPVNRKGHFRERVRLNEGTNQLTVESYDLGGNNARSTSPRMLVDTRPDGFQIRTSPDMWENKKK